MALDTDDAPAGTGKPTRGRGLFGTPYLHIPQFRQATPAPAPASPDDPRAEDARENLYTAAAALSASMAAQQAELHALCAAIYEGLALIRKAARPGVYTSFSLKASQPYTLDTQDYAHSFLLLTAAQSVIFDIPGVGSVTRALVADWNRLDYPSGTRIYLTSDPASPVNALLRLQDIIINV